MDTVIRRRLRSLRMFLIYAALIGTLLMYGLFVRTLEGETYFARKEFFIVQDSLLNERMKDI